MRSHRSTRRVSNHHEPPLQQPVADDAAFTVVPAAVIELKRDALEHQRGVFEGKAASRKRAVALGLVEGDPHRVNVATLTCDAKGARKRPPEGIPSQKMPKSKLYRCFY